ncbi:MAG: hypothetical protein IPK13_10840 [Deltaproteobacteria bacterium]|nr:hypothetical protein [Deltaproteobacteria bacterium]
MGSRPVGGGAFRPSRPHTADAPRPSLLEGANRILGPRGARRLQEVLAQEYLDACTSVGKAIIRGDSASPLDRLERLERTYARARDRNDLNLRPVDATELAIRMALDEASVAEVREGAVTHLLTTARKPKSEGGLALGGWAHRGQLGRMVTELPTTNLAHANPADLARALSAAFHLAMDELGPAFLPWKRHEQDAIAFASNVVRRQVSSQKEADDYLSAVKILCTFAQRPGTRRRVGLGMTRREAWKFATRELTGPHAAQYADRFVLAFELAVKPLRRGGKALPHRAALDYARKAARDDDAFERARTRLRLSDPIGQLYITAHRPLDRGGLGLTQPEAAAFAEEVIVAHPEMSEDDLALLIDALSRSGSHTGSERPKFRSPGAVATQPWASHALPILEKLEDIRASSETNEAKAIAFASRPTTEGGLGYDSAKAKAFADELMKDPKHASENIAPQLRRIERLIRTLAGQRHHGELELQAKEAVPLALKLIAKLPRDGNCVRDFAADVRKLFRLLWHDMDDGGFGGAKSRAREVVHRLVDQLDPEPFGRFVSEAETAAAGMRSLVSTGRMNEGEARAKAKALVETLAHQTGAAPRQESSPTDSDSSSTPSIFDHLAGLSTASASDEANSSVATN